MVDSDDDDDGKEEVFSVYDDHVGLNVVETVLKPVVGAVQLIFPLRVGDGDGQWCWNICGGLIGGQRGKRFCTKNILGTNFSHCGVGSHSMNKASLEPEHGYPQCDRSGKNTESAHISPSVSGSHFPNSINDLAGQALSHEEWVAFLAHLPNEREVSESEGLDFEIAAEALEKSKMLVSFAVTPARQKSKLPVLMSQIMETVIPWTSWNCRLQT